MSYSLNLTYHPSHNVTHILLKEFFNGFVVHERFINDELLVLRINKNLKRQLRIISTELDHIIVRLYYVVS